MEGGSDVRAFAYSAPVVADLDGDGELEVVVATSARKLHVVQGSTGATREGFPVDLEGEVQGQIAVVSVRRNVCSPCVSQSRSLRSSSLIPCLSMKRLRETTYL